jgi:hypothetical protein
VVHVQKNGGHREGKRKGERNVDRMDKRWIRNIGERWEMIIPYQI